MTSHVRVSSVGAGFAAALIAGLALSACANKRRPILWLRPAWPRPAASRTSSSTSATACSSRPIPTELTAAGARDARQAGAVAAAVRQLHLHHRRPRRRARHARIQHRARRPPRSDGARLSRVPRHPARPHAHRLLRQGAAGRGLQRHLVLVAEPPRGHGARRHLVGRGLRACRQDIRRPLGRRFAFEARAVTFWSLIEPIC